MKRNARLYLPWPAVSAYLACVSSPSCRCTAETSQAVSFG